MFRGTEQEIRLKRTLFFTLLGVAAFGIICRLLSGESWSGGFFGAHYWALLAGLVLLLALLFAAIVYRVKKGKVSYVYTAIEAFHKYGFLIRQLTRRDFKTKYKRSILGVLWSFLNPLLMMIVQYIVFSTIFRSNIEHFAAYLIIGNVCFSFFSEACSLTLNSIVGNAGLITKVYMPKYIYPLTRTISSLVNLAISLIPMLLVCLITGVRFTATALLSPFFFFCLFLFSLGMGMLLSCLMVFFRDTQFLWGILTTIWMYFTPIFYSINMLPETLQKLIGLNPLYIYISGVRCCLMYNVSPLPGTYLKAIAASAIMLLAGALAFKKGQDKFILYL